IPPHHDLLTPIQNAQVQILINTITKPKQIQPHAFQIPPTTLQNPLPSLTSLHTPTALTNLIQTMTFTIRNL
uniref:hypothetical protein n=1 Tax=Staphylococcus epidermidis TaxID=1282 RepID=UPI001C92F573